MAELTLETADGIRLSAEGLHPEGTVRGVVVVLHGAGDHRGRLTVMQRALLAGGFAVLAFDLRGHGRSGGERGHVEHWQAYRADLAAGLTHARAWVAKRPVFVWGHGLGGLIALDAAVSPPVPLAGVVASAPALVYAGLRRPLRDAAWQLLNWAAPRRRIVRPGAGAALSHDLGVMAAFRADPWVQTRMTVHTVLEWGRMMATTRAAAARVTVPVLLLHGRSDPVYAVTGSETFVAECGHRDATLRVYDANLHEVHHDTARLQMERDVLRWLRERAMRRTPTPSVAEPAIPSL